MLKPSFDCGRLAVDNNQLITYGQFTLTSGQDVRPML